jgi:hypothetical protein
LSEIISAADRLKAQGRLEEIDALIAELTKRREDIKSAIAQEASYSTSALESLAESLDWRRNKFGEWCFLNEKDGTPIQRLKPLAQAIRGSTAEKLILGAFEYSVSGGKFLNRRRV